MPMPQMPQCSNAQSPNAPMPQCPNDIDTPKPNPNKEPRYLILHSISAIGVPDADAAGGSDPYVRFILLDSLKTNYVLPISNYCC